MLNNEKKNCDVSMPDPGMCFHRYLEGVLTGMKYIYGRQNKMI